MRFTEPVYLVLLLPLLGWVWWTGRGLLGVSKARRRTILFLRGLLITLIVLALAGAQWVMTPNRVCTIFVLDESASISDEGREQARQFIREALSKSPSESLTGLILFGADAQIEWLPSEGRTFQNFQARPDPDGTEIAGALRLATALFPPGYARRIVLLSDGNETTGLARTTAEVARTESIAIDTVLLPTAVGANEVLIEQVELPSTVKVGEPFPVRMTVRAQDYAQARIVLDREGTPVKTLNVSLSPGVNLITTSLKSERTGAYRLRATLDSSSDTDPRNNLGLALTRVQGEPTVLIAEGQAGISEPLVRALRENRIRAEVVGRHNFPSREERLQDYDAILLNDYPADALSPQQMIALQNAVRDTGVGFIMIGGERSYQPGGYFGTPIAEMLPVDLEVRHREVIHASTVVLIVDASGSMNNYIGQHKVAHLAAEASIKTLQMLRENDRFGVIISSHGSDWLTPDMADSNADPFSCDGRVFQGCHGRRAGQPASAIYPIGEREAIIKVLNRIYGTGGGIFVRGSLEMARAGMLQEMPNRSRHIVMFADADDCDEQEGSLEIARQLRAMGVTLSVIAFGKGKDTQFLKALARTGGGKFYETVDASALPRLFTADVSTMTRNMIEEGAFIPKVNATDERLREVNWSRTPPLLAYNLTSERPLAQTLMRTHKDDPLLAIWQYGLGKVAAFTSDAQARWAGRWVAWGDYSVFWANLVRSVMRPSETRNYTLTASIREGKGIAELQAFTPSGEPITSLTPKLRVGLPNGEQREIGMQVAGAGRYQAQFPLSGTGLYTLGVQETLPDGTQLQVSTGLAVPYPQEYRFTRPNRALMEQVASITGGRFNPQPAQVYERPPIVQPAHRDLWSLAVLVALLLLMVDITIRRVVMGVPEFISVLLKQLHWRRRLRPQTAPATATRLQQAKARAGTRRVSAEEGNRQWVGSGNHPGAPIEPAPNASPANRAHAPPTPSNESADTLSRLLSAKKRTR